MKTTGAFLTIIQQWNVKKWWKYNGKSQQESQNRITQRKRKQITTYIINVTTNEHKQGDQPFPRDHRAKADYTNMTTMYQARHKREETP